MKKDLLKDTRNWIWKNGWKTPGLGLFFYPFKTEKKGLDAVKNYLPHFILGIPTLFKIGGLVGASYLFFEGYKSSGEKYEAAKSKLENFINLDGGNLNQEETRIMYKLMDIEEKDANYFPNLRDFRRGLNNYEKDKS